MKEEDKLTKQIKDTLNHEIENDLDHLEKLEEELNEIENEIQKVEENFNNCLLYTSPSPRDSV